ncbi:MAG: tetratricopeptide repeat protein [Candidatus Krumholzibacteriia bacterium]
MPDPGRRVLLAIAILCANAAVPAAAQPEDVPRYSERPLDQASYVELARRWQAYIDEHGATAEALVNLGMAYDYAKELEAALVAARQAVELEPDDPRALEFLGKMLLTYGDDEEAALEVLERCRRVAPDYEHGLTTLAATYLRRGDLHHAEETMRTVFQRRLIAHPLQDYAYNMLVGLPAGAVLITSGDNDTFPVLALQAGMEFRPDVVVLNRSLLNVPGYATAMFERHGNIAPDHDIDGHEVRMVDGHPTLLSIALIEALIERGDVPVYVSASALEPFHGQEFEGQLEGINLRVGESGMGADDSARLLLSTYRMDSATDWTFAWSLVPGIAQLMRNYVAAMGRLADREETSAETRTALLDRAEEIARFHGMERMETVIRALRQR